MLASELRPEAARLGRDNADQILGAESGGAERLRILEVAGATEVFQPFRSALNGARADFLVSNPPYMATGDGIENEVRDYEPRTALFAPDGDPLFFYREVAQQAGAYLKPGAWIWMETPHERAEEILDLFVPEHGWDFACLIRDLNQHQRVLEARRSHAANP
jgi:methylase of polypeptide subunit release factors